MLCEQCQKREAIVRYVEVANGVKMEHNLCGQCAAKMDIGPFSAVFEGDVSLATLLSGLLGIHNREDQNEPKLDIVCPTCGRSYERFADRIRLGCADCYQVFGPVLEEKIRHIQGSDRHVGKRPAYMADTSVQAKTPDGVITNGENKETDVIRPLTKQEQIRILQTRLKDAVRREDYHEAAALRDEIRSLKEET